MNLYDHMYSEMTEADLIVRRYAMFRFPLPMSGVKGNHVFTLLKNSVVNLLGKKSRLQSGVKVKFLGP